ncbi:MAG: hypothetical protein A2042_02900 [Candidatus Schekmanbacteria bacterium GWA2_38_11]|uniref:Ada DNA repair metal-binding domain-containing protein n=1 Tax=Candidatus Schekmanbacteria bacterium GWA2_38_11 TaxID=1817876 RepID=A0A1F7RF49_9BACT|nr:MAG: hypothetical protein A2042_02900 [Candidatus Schekmanbacteria bacterium GWA2_38_11]
MKKLVFLSLIFFFTISLLVTVSLADEQTKFVGSKNSNKYHFPDCKWAQKINPKNLVTFTSVEEAKKAGYIPCKVCKPPEK